MAYQGIGGVALALLLHNLVEHGVVDRGPLVVVGGHEAAVGGHPHLGLGHPVGAQGEVQPNPNHHLRNECHLKLVKSIDKLYFLKNTSSQGRRYTRHCCKFIQLETCQLYFYIWPLFLNTLKTHS